MTHQPEHPKIYHITHVDNLRGILNDDCLFSDRAIQARGGPKADIGISRIKKRRLELPVSVQPGTKVGEYVPFYFCPRSIMLFVLHKGNSPGLEYHDGQEPLVHLVADLHEAIEWAESERRQWAFSLSNAGARYALFHNRRDHLGKLDWSAINSRDFQSSEIKEKKQAEFLMHESFPWHLIRSIGVCSHSTRQHVESIAAQSSHHPTIEVHKEWYF